MQGYLGGYILIPTQEVRRSVDVLEAALPASWKRHIAKMTAYIDIQRRTLDLGATNKTFAALREAGTGSIVFHLFHISAFLHAEESLEDYTVLAIDFEEVPFLGLRDEDHDAFTVDWTQLCQQAHASFGYFGRFSYNAEEEYLHETILPALRSQNFEQLGAQFSDCWLQYYGPQVLHKTTGRQTLEHALVEVIQDFEYKVASLTNLDNGGLLFRSGKYPLDTGERNQ
jgi:hypothetical protein